MLTRHEDRRSESCKRNLVLSQKNAFSTLLLILFLLFTSGSATLFAALPSFGSPSGPFHETGLQISQYPQLPSSGNAHPFQFQLKKQLEAGGHLNIIEVNTRLQQGTFDFNAWIQTDGITVCGTVSGGNNLPDEDWAIVEVLDENGQVLEKYLVLTNLGDYLIVDLEH